MWCVCDFSVTHWMTFNVPVWYYMKVGGKIKYLFIADKSHAGRFVIFLAFWLCVVIVKSTLLARSQSQHYGQKASGVWQCHCKQQFFSNTEGETNQKAMTHSRAVKKPPNFKGPETPNVWINRYANHFRSRSCSAVWRFGFLFCILLNVRRMIHAWHVAAVLGWTEANFLTVPLNLVM